MDKERKSDWDRIMDEKERAESEYAEKKARNEFLNKVEQYGLQNVDDAVNYVRIQLELTRELNRMAAISNNTITYNETNGVREALKHILDLFLIGDEVLSGYGNTEELDKDEEAMTYA